MKIRAALLASALTLLAPAIARADAEDVVTVNDGTQWRGHITELVGGDHVTLRLANGQDARIRWDAIVRLDRAGTTPPGPSVRVVIAADRDVVLERVDPNAPRSRRYETICVSPCGRDVPIGTSYRIGGPGVRGSSVFALGGQPGDTVRLDVEAGSTGRLVGGIIMTSLGGATFIVGGAFMLLAVGARNIDTNGFEIAGGVCMAVGAGVAIPGIVMLSSASTRVDVDVPRRGAPPQGLPAAVVVPLVGRSF